MDGPVGGVLICALRRVSVNGHQSRTLETYSRWDLVFGDRVGAVSSTVRMSPVSWIVSGERVDGVTSALILRILDKFIWVDVF